MLSIIIIWFLSNLFLIKMFLVKKRTRQVTKKKQKHIYIYIQGKRQLPLVASDIYNVILFTNFNLWIITFIFQ